METNDNKRISILVEDSDQKKTDDLSLKNEQYKIGKLKKPLIYILMALAFIGCLYLIFKPSSNEKQNEIPGLNGAVPQASDLAMQSDKQKAYEQELFDQKEKDRTNALTSLADYWNGDSTEHRNSSLSSFENGVEPSAGNRVGNPALESYRNAQTTLGSFYNDDHSESRELRKQVDELKKQLTERDAVPAPYTVNDQLELMEKSYQMAAKYLPSNNASQTIPTGLDSIPESNRKVQKESFTAFAPMRSNAVSSLYREPSNTEFMENVNSERNRGFYNAGTVEQISKPKNSIRACIHGTQTISNDGTVKLRLLEAAKTPEFTIPAGSLVTAGAKFNNGRLQLKITTIESDGNIQPVDISIYDLDGQLGLHIPYSPEMNALSEIASNMSQTSGTSIMMTRSAGQQMAADLSRGVVQGVSGYFSKKVRTVKVTLKAGHQVFLVSKK